MLRSMLFLWPFGALVLAGCADGGGAMPASSSNASQSTQKANPLLQPLGTNLPAQDPSLGSNAEPSPAAIKKMLPYLGQGAYSDAVPTIELRPFRECFARAIFSTMTFDDRAEFERVVASGEIYNNDEIVRLSSFFNRAIESQQVRATAEKLCPGYASAISSM